MKKDIREKVESCKALQGKTVLDICETQRFQDNIAAYLTAQKEDRKAIRASYEAMRKLGGTKGYKLPAHVLDRLMGLSVDEFVGAFIQILAGVSNRPHSERIYIEQLGRQAYNLTVAQFVVEEFPELADELIPKAKNN